MRDTKRGIMYEERESSNHMEMKEIEVAAIMMNIGVDTFLKAERSKSVRNNPKIYAM